MKRYHEEQTIIQRNHREHLRIHGWPKKKVTCVCDLQAGRFRKRDAYDCGNARCRICHWEKFINNGKHAETRKEQIAGVRQREQMQELE